MDNQKNKTNILYKITQSLFKNHINMNIQRHVNLKANIKVLSRLIEISLLIGWINEGKPCILTNL